MQPTILAIFLDFPSTAFLMSAAGLALLVIGLLAAKNDIAQARGIDKVVALTHLCFAIPLAVFGAEHLSDGKSLLNTVPSYMTWRLFWVYFVGFALIAASLSIATKIQVRWPAVCSHDVPLCGDAAYSGGGHRRRPNRMDDHLSGNVVRGRRLGHLLLKRNSGESQRMQKVLNAEKDRRDRDQHAPHSDETLTLSLAAHRDSRQNPSSAPAESRPQQRSEMRPSDSR
jgi:hypothetical protein